MLYTRFLILTALMAAGCTTPGPTPHADAGFQYLETTGAAIVALDPLPLRVEAHGFRATPVVNRAATFGEHPFEVSLAALLQGGEAVLVHAERVADASGASNYDSLPQARWPDSRFRLRTQCVAVDAATAGQEHDLAFLRGQGWNPAGQLALEQYLATTPDHNREVVVSLVTHVSDCARNDEVQAALDRLRAKVSVH